MHHASQPSLSLRACALLWVLALGGCPASNRTAGTVHPTLKPPRRVAPPAQPRCVKVAYLPPWACLPQKKKGLRTLPSAVAKASLNVSGGRIPVRGRLDQQAPVAWIKGNRTRVTVAAHTTRLWIRGRVLASRVRFVLRKGTRLYSGPKGGLVGLLTGALTVVPRTYQNGRVSFEFHTPVNSVTPAAMILWAPSASFRHDARSSAVPAAWSDRAGAPLPANLASRLDDLFYLFVEGSRQGMLSLSRCASAGPRIRLLERRGDKLRVTIRPVSALSKRLGPVLLRGWIYLKPKPKRSGHAPGRSRMYCAYVGRAAPMIWQYGGGTHVTTRPLPLYLSPHPGRAPVGVLLQHASVRVHKTTLVGRGRHRFLRVQGPALLYVPYHPGLFRRPAPGQSSQP